MSLNEKVPSIEKVGPMVTANTIVPSTKKIGPTVYMGAKVPTIEKVVLKVTTNITMPSKKKVDLAAGITKSRDKILSIMELLRKYSLIKCLFR